MGARRRWTIMGICASALFLVGLDTTIVTVGLPEIGRALDVEEERRAWVVDAYTILFASLLITSGALADRFGRRRVFGTGLVVFAAASLACALAPSLGWLIAARAVQGIGASMLSPVALAIVVTTMQGPREKAMAIGIWSSVFGVSMAVGPVTGGALLAVADWRALFWVGVPVALAALLLVVLLVPESRGRMVRRLDLPGQMLLTLLLGIGVALLIEGPQRGGGAPVVVAGGIALVLLAVVFIVVEGRRREPLMDPVLFRSPRFVGAVVGAIAVFVAFSMTLLMSTSYLQGDLGWSPLAAGAASLPMAIGATACAPLSGFLVGRAGPGVPLLIASAALTAGGLLFLPATGTGGTMLVPLAYLVVGIGVGFANAPITSTAVSALPEDRAGVAGGVASTARQVGTAVGIAVAAGLFSGGGGTAGWLMVAACGAVLLVVARRTGR